MYDKAEHVRDEVSGGSGSIRTTKNDEPKGSIVWAIYIIALLVFIGLIIAVLNF